MSVAWVSAGVGVVGILAGNSASRQASSQAADANAAALAAQESATGGRLAFDKQVYSDGAADRQFASETARTNAANLAEDRTKYNALQDEQIARGRKFQGTEDAMLADAQNFDTEGKREELAGKAMGDVNQGFANAKAQAVRSQQRMGVDPNSGRALATGNQMAIGQALGLSSAATTARTQAETQGYARKMDAVGLGKGVIGNQATQANLQTTAGNGSVNSSLVPLSVARAANSDMSAGYGNAAAGYQGLASGQASSFYNAQRYGAGVGSNVGNMFGSLSGIGMDLYRNTRPSATVPQPGAAIDMSSNQG